MCHYWALTHWNLNVVLFLIWKAVERQKIIFNGSELGWLAYLFLGIGHHQHITLEGFLTARNIWILIFWLEEWKTKIWFQITPNVRATVHHDWLIIISIFNNVSHIIMSTSDLPCVGEMDNSHIFFIYQLCCQAWFFPIPTMSKIHKNRKALLLIKNLTKNMKGQKFYRWSRKTRQDNPRL